MLNTIYSSSTISISDFKKSPMQYMKDNEAILVLNKNKPVFYCVPVEVYEELMEDIELASTAAVRKDEKTIKLNIVNI